MDTNILFLVYVVAAHMLFSMMMMIIATRKRKRQAHTPIGKISYGPMGEKDRMWIEYFNDKI
jgi:hypothetical protein